MDSHRGTYPEGWFPDAQYPWMHWPDATKQFGQNISWEASVPPLPSIRSNVEQVIEHEVSQSPTATCTSVCVSSASAVFDGSLSFHTHALSGKRRIDPATKRDNEMSRWLQTWTDIFELVGDASPRYIAFKQLEPSARQVAIEDLFGLSSAATLRKHAAPILLWIRHCASLRLAPFPMSEHCIVAFLQQRISEGCAPTWPQSFCECIKFLHETLKVDNLAKEKSVQGACRKSLKRKRLTKHAPALSTGMVAVSESAAIRSTRLSDRLMAKALCFMLYARKRLADTYHIRLFQAKLTTDYLEGVGLSTKVSERGGRIREGVPFAAPRIGITGYDLFESFQTELKDAMLLDGRQASQVVGIFFVPTANGRNVLPYHLEPSEVTNWLRDLLLAAAEASSNPLGYDAPEVVQVTGHGLGKATILTWLGRRGVSRSDRRLLGEHKRPGDRIVDLYDRRALDAPLRKLRGMLAEIRAGAFHPDGDIHLSTSPVTELEQAAGSAALGASASRGHELAPGGAVTCHFRTDRKSKSRTTEEAALLEQRSDEIKVKFHDGVCQWIPREWLRSSAATHSESSSQGSFSDSAASENSDALANLSHLEQSLGQPNPVDEAEGSFTVYLPNMRVHILASTAPQVTACDCVPGPRWISIPSLASMPAASLCKNCFSSNHT